MDKLLTPQTFEFFAQYVLSGFVVIAIANAFVFGKKPKPAEAFIEIVLYSLLTQLVWLGLASFGQWWVTRDGIVTARELNWTPGKTLQFYLKVLIVPALIGWLLGFLGQKRWLHPVLRFLSFPIADPYPRAYDHIFAEFVGEALVVIHYEDGQSVFGKFGLNSRASRDPNHSELFIERLYSVDDDGTWTPSEPPRSAFVSLAGVRAIEFLKFEDLPEDNVNGTQTNS